MALAQHGVRAWFSQRTSITLPERGRSFALEAQPRSLPCSAGVRFLPGLKGGASSEEPGGGGVPRVDGQPAMPGGAGPVLSLRTASRGGNIVSTTVHREHRCDLWDAAARG
ncbi:hypothetical protein GCM10010317_017820 [Streptomyces mirabilis]|nr:hypothetical protein GCM10010317_017820 [Streptomyces mirabilis]